MRLRRSTARAEAVPRRLRRGNCSERGGRRGLGILKTGLVFLSILGSSACVGDAPGTQGDEIPVVLLGGGRAEVHLVPGRVVVPSGQRVRFTTVDRRVHTIRFAVDDMSPGPRAFLESTGQVASPPLLERGAVFEVWFRDAPRGFYPFWAEGHSEPVEGVIVVE